MGKTHQHPSYRLVLTFLLLLFGLATTRATVSVSSLFGSNMVLQRDQAVPVWGSAAAGRTITVTYNGQTKTATSDAQGNWQLYLDPMAVKTVGSNMTISESGGNTLTFTNVVVGDVWYCSGQSNMAWSLNGCNRPTDISSANFPNLRHIYAPMVTSRDPLRTISASWQVSTPTTAGGFSAVGFYFGRKIYQDQGSAIPIGLITTSIGGTVIDIWLAPEGLTDIPVIQPLFTQEIMPWGPFSAFNGMVYPFAPFGAKGMIWYQGENREKTSQSTDSYYLKEKALQQGWQRALGVKDFALYVVQLANWLDASTTATPDGLGSWSDTRQMQEMVARLPHGGMASAIDVGEAADIHPKDKLDVGERLALWALKNDYGRTVVTSGPILRDVNVVNSTVTYPARKSVVCSFDYVGSGLMVGSKTPYLPTTEVVGGTLQRFVIAGSSGVYYAADAIINGDTVEVSSASVTTPTKVAYAYWINPAGANLYNREGLPASPFSIDDVTAKYTVTATAGAGGSITPAGVTTYLKRRNPLYTITPDAGFFIQDVKVDNVSVGSVRAYTFDPLYANHTISATFAATAPTYTITTTGNASGSISPAGPLNLAQGSSQLFKMVPNANCRLISVTLDGAPLGNRSSVALTDVRTNHAISAFFAPIPAPGTGTGLRGDYYAGTNFEVFRTTRTDATVNFDWTTGSPVATLPADGFTVRWSGQIQPQFAETYKFYLSHDEGARLWVNNTLLINNWNAAVTDDSGSIALTAGTKYDIRLELIDLSGNANCKLEWYSPSLPREVVPQTQLFPATTPIYTITATPGPNGSFSPTGAVLVVTGSNQTFNVVPNTGFTVADVKVDNSSIGVASSYTFTNVTANHSITATFTALPSYNVSGKVTINGTSTAISGAKVNFYTGPDAIGNAAYTATTDAAGLYSANIPMGTWYMVSAATGYFNSSARLLTVSDAVVTNINFGLVSNTRNIPNTTNILFSGVTDTLPASGTTGPWATYAPSGQSLTTMGSPTVETIMGRKWEKNVYTDTDGFQFGSTYNSAIACTGASIVIAAKPTRSPDSGNWRSLIDIFYDRLVLGIMNNDGSVCVRRNGSVDFSSTKIPDGRVTILSMVVGTDGSYNVYTNGGATPILTGAATGANTFTNLNPLWNGGGTGFWSYMNVGRNAPDGWTTSNGYIGDFFVYKTALTTAERQQIEADMMSKFVHGGVTSHIINASAGAGGTISLPGSTAVVPGSSQSYSITPSTGYKVSDVTVDGTSVGAVTSYTFSNVTTPHAIAARFAPLTYTITASAGANGSISPSGAVSVSYGSNQAFTITPGSGYRIVQVTVDGVNQGTGGSYTFNNVTGNHTIAASFALLTYSIEANAGPNGTITPAGAVTVNHGANQSFTIAPAPSYEILQVAVDGVNQGAIPAYNFTNVVANHTISAEFQQIPAPQFYSVKLLGDYLELKFFGGTNRDVWLLSATNGGAGMSNWVPIETNAVGADGLGTNMLRVIQTEQQRYFRLQIP